MVDELAPELSVIIPARNAAPWLQEQLDALAGQTYPRHFEVIVADNGSTDRTREVAQSHVLGDRIRVVDASGPRTASHGRNVGAAAARSDILLFCDADDLVSPDWVSELARPVVDDPEAVVTGALHHERFNAPEVLAAYHIDRDPDAVDGDASGVLVPGGFAGYLPTVAGGNFAIRRARYLALGGMDPRYPGGAEETDFAWRAQEAGLHVVAAPKAVVHYRLKSEPGHLFRQQRIQQRGRMYLWTRYRHTSMQGPSFKSSLKKVISGLAMMPRVIRGDLAERLAWAAHVGAHVGALEGMLRYRGPVAGLARGKPDPMFRNGMSR